MANKQILVFSLLVALCCSFNFSTTLTVYNDFIQDIYPAYPADPREGVWTIQPLNIEPGKYFKSQVVDQLGFNGSTFWVQFINYYQQFVAEIHVATPFRDENKLTFLLDQRYEIDYFMKCGSTQRLNQVVTRGFPCEMHVILSHKQVTPVKRTYERQVELDSLENYEIVENGLKIKTQLLVLDKQTGSYVNTENNTIVGSLKQKSVQCIVNIINVQTDSSLCQQKLEETVNRISIKPIANKEYNFEFNKYGNPLNITMKKEDTKDNKFHLSMIGATNKCKEYVSLAECRGVVEITQKQHQNTKKVQKKKQQSEQQNKQSLNEQL